MKAPLHISQDAVVFIGDGRKALFLRNKGDEKFPNLVTEEVFLDENPQANAHGVDGSGHANPGASRKANGIGVTTWHDVDEHRFAQSVAGALQRLVRDQHIKQVVVVAPPKTLADLRQSFHKDVSQRIVAEINKDFTKLPIDQIEQQLFA